MKKGSEPEKSNPQFHEIIVNVIIMIQGKFVIQVIVIAWGQGFMAVNEPSPRAQPEDKVCLRCHKSLATRAITVIYPT